MMRRASTWFLLLALLAPASLVSGQEPIEPPSDNPFAEPGPRPRRPRPAAAQETAPAEPAEQEAPAERPVVQPAQVVAEPEPAEAELAPAQAIEPQAEGDAPLSDEALDQALDEALGDEAFGATEAEAQEPLEAEALGEEAGENEHELAPADAEHAEHEGHEAGAAHDEHAGEHHGFDFVGFMPSLVNFLLLLAILVWLLRRPMTEFLKNRRLAVVEGLEESKRLKAAAEAKYREYSERLEHLDEELEKLRKEMIQAGEAERDRIIAEAESRAARMRKDAQFVIDQQLKQLRTDLTREAIEAAVAAAGAVLAEQTGAADQQRLADDYLGKLAESVKDEEVRA